MNLEVNNINGVINLIVLGNITKKLHIETLKSEIDNIKGESIISFFDAKVLPEAVIESLINISSCKKVKIQVAHTSLSSYFFRLGIPHILLPNKSIYKKEKIKALVIGGSAGSLDRILSIIQSLPKEDIVIFIVQHILEDKSNYLHSILKEKTSYNVKEAEDREIIENGYVYIAPPSYHIRVAEGKINLSKDAPVNFARPSIDVLFESLSLEYGAGLAAILLSGYNDDGTHSLEYLIKNRSRVLIQDPLECIEKELLLNAINTKNYNYIFPLPEMIHYIKRQIEPQKIELDRAKVSKFLEDINDKYGYDYRRYDYSSLSRLIVKEMNKYNLESFEDFKEQVLNYSENFESLFLEFSINVTEFFRNPQVFNKIRSSIFHYLSSYPHIKIWCAGSSTGEEPYSLAIILKEQGLLEKSQIYATDINPYIIEQAKNGFFSEKNIEKNNTNYLEAGGVNKFRDYFDKVNNVLKIKQELKENILFFQHSLVSTGILNEFNLILCRNVIIYFDEYLQQKTMELFKNSLSPNGFLILGESEYIKNNSIFNNFDKKLKIFKKLY